MLVSKESPKAEHQSSKEGVIVCSSSLGKHLNSRIPFHVNFTLFSHFSYQLADLSINH